MAFNWLALKLRRVSSVTLGSSWELFILVWNFWHGNLCLVSTAIVAFSRSHSCSQSRCFVLCLYTLLPVLEANLCLVLVEANKGKNNQAHGPLCTLSIFLTAMTKCTAEALTSSCMSVLLSVMGKKKKPISLFL